MKILLSIVLIMFAKVAFAETVFTARAPESQSDKRQNYTYQLLDLALNKTVDSHGPYRIELAPSGTNVKRALRDVERGKYENYFLRQSVSKETVERLEAVPFPVDLGIVGYRVAFTSADKIDHLKGMKSIDDLKKMTVVQGIGWLDTKILTSQGFIVDTSSSYESMFTMVARGRADLFIRGANELFGEWETHKGTESLAYDESFALYYPLPRFFFTTKSNTQNAERVYQGLIQAYEDGSLIKLWRKNYGPSIEFVKLHKRKIFSAQNPFLDGVDTSYKKYLYDPYSE